MKKPLIDRFEGEVAVLLYGTEERKVSRDKLPPGAREGDVLDPSTFAVDEAATRSAQEDLRKTREAAFAGKKSTPGGAL